MIKQENKSRSQNRTEEHVANVLINKIIIAILGCYICNCYTCYTKLPQLLLLFAILNILTNRTFII